jgi:hypothetical protein
LTKSYGVLRINPREQLSLGDSTTPNNLDNHLSFGSVGRKKTIPTVASIGLLLGNAIHHGRSRPKTKEDGEGAAFNSGPAKNGHWFPINPSFQGIEILDGVSNCSKQFLVFFWE